MDDRWLSEGEVLELVAEAPSATTLWALRRTLRRAAVVAGVVLTVAAGLALLRKATHPGQHAHEADWEEVTGM